MNDVTKDLLEAMKRAKGKLVAFKFIPGEANRWEESDEEALAAIDSAIARAEAALAEPQPEADGWIPWAGGECPVDANVEVIIKDRSGKVWRFGVAGDYDWNHDEEPLDILFYRIVEAQP
jgi:hypothetical protein